MSEGVPVWHGSLGRPERRLTWTTSSGGEEDPVAGLSMIVSAYAAAQESSSPTRQRALCCYVLGHLELELLRHAMLRKCKLWDIERKLSSSLVDKGVRLAEDHRAVNRSV